MILILCQRKNQMILIRALFFFICYSIQMPANIRVFFEEPNTRRSSYARVQQFQAGQMEYNSRKEVILISIERKKCDFIRKNVFSFAGACDVAMGREQMEGKGPCGPRRIAEIQKGEQRVCRNGKPGSGIFAAKHVRRSSRSLHGQNVGRVGGDE